MAVLVLAALAVTSIDGQYEQEEETSASQSRTKKKTTKKKTRRRQRGEPLRRQLPRSATHFRALSNR